MRSAGNRQLPILMLTVMDSEDDKVLALDAGMKRLHYQAIPIARIDRASTLGGAQKEHSGQ